MFKVYFLLAGEPFQYEGLAAEEAVLEAYPLAVGYVQARSLAEQLPGGEAPAYTGAAELWFRDAGDALEAGEKAFTLSDADVQATVVGAERIVMRLPDHHTEKRIKGVYPFRRKPGMPVSDFQRHWWHNHGPIAALTEEALCYVQTHVLAECYDEGSPRYDGITELHFRNRDAAVRATVSRQMREDQGGDAPNFVDMDSIELFLVEEEVVIRS